MTDQEVIRVLDSLEVLLAAMPLDQPNAQAIAQWHEAFQKSVASAERGPRWPEVLDRARVLGKLLKRREVLLQAAQRRLKEDLNTFAMGRKALNAYRTGPR